MRDGVVDFSDFQEWKAAFLAGGGSLEGVDLGFTANVPEPNTVALLLAALAAAATCKNRNLRAGGRC